jgi:hypothetical protein
MDGVPLIIDFVERGQRERRPRVHFYRASEFRRFRAGASSR